MFFIHQEMALARGIRAPKGTCNQIVIIIIKIKNKTIIFVFSSPEHKVLMVSYCDQTLSVVRRPCVVHFLL